MTRDHGRKHRSRRNGRPPRDKRVCECTPGNIAACGGYAKRAARVSGRHAGGHAKK